MEYDRALEAGLIQKSSLNEYLDNIIDNIDMQVHSQQQAENRPIPCTHGVSETSSIKTILLTARCEVDTIHERHDTLFGGKPAPTAATLRPLQNFVLDGKCDIESLRTGTRPAGSHRR